MTFGWAHGPSIQTSDPARALANIIARDELIARHIQHEAQARGLATLAVDGSLLLDDMLARVAAHFTA